MTSRNLSIGAGLVLAFLFCAAADSNVFGQGRGGGRPAGVGGGPPSGVGGGRPSGIGQPNIGPGVDRGLGTASSRSNGRSDAGLGNASTRSHGRSDAGLDRARAARDKANHLSDNDLNRYRGLSKKLGTTPEEMRARYQAALMANPNLTYGQFVAANVIADNMSGRRPGITSGAILSGLANGDSIGQTLQNLGISKNDSKAAEKDAERRIDGAKKKNK